MDFLDYIKMCQDETVLKESDTDIAVNRQENQVRMDDFVQERGRGCLGKVYKVQKGDTLYSISRNYNLKVRDLMRANPYVNVYQLQIGEELCIPVVQNSRPEPGVRPYAVKRGDTVLSILKENEITFQELARLNRSAQVLRFPAGTVLLLPK